MKPYTMTPTPPRPLAALSQTRTPDLLRRPGLLAASVLLAFIGAPHAVAQAAPPPDNEPPPPDQVVKLDPFTVTEQTEGYKAVDTLAGARVQTRLVDTPSALSVVTKSFLEDTGITDAQQLLVYTTNTEVAGLNGNFSGVAARGIGVSSNAEAARLLNPNAVNRSRGLSPMDNTRNYFGSEIPWDSFNISRVDISRGPNSFLFGVGSPSGIANYSTNEAVFQDSGSIEARIGSFGTTREALDYNKVLITGQLAARIDLLNNDTQYRQKPAFNHAKRAYVALRYDPKALDTPNSHFKLQANAESGRVRSNNPRELPPMDFITGYFSGGGLNKGGYDPFLYNTGQQLTGVGSFSGSGNPPPTPPLNPWVNQQDYHYIWPGPNAAYWYDAKSGALLQAMTTLNGPISVTGGTIGGFPQAAGIYTTGFANYARTINYRDPSLAPGAYAGTVFYNDKSLSDPSIFNFYDSLIDGRNKEEWQNWKAFNVTLEETLLGGRLAVQGVVDHQEFDQGQAGIFGYTEPFISVDLDAYSIMFPSWLPNLAVRNPNVGRAFAASDFGSGDNSTRFVHDNYQLTANGDLRAEDFLPKGTLADILGHQSLTGLVGEYKTTIDARAWSGFATDPAFGVLMGDPQAKINANRAISWVSYLGPSMIDVSSPSGLHLNNIGQPITPTSGTILHFVPTWAPPAGVNPGDPWTDPSPYATNPSTQANNPANYRGWSTIPVNVLNWKQNINDLYQSGSRTEQKLRSAALMYQGHFWDDTILPEWGWRRDTIRQRSSNAPLDPRTAVANMNYGITGDDVTFRTTSTSYGVTLHLPKALRNKLPYNTDVSFYYFRGENETPRVRYAFDASLLPAESGKTDDYAIQVDTLDGRATIRLTYFKTVDKNAQAGSGAADPLGNNGYYMYLLPAWGAADAAANARAVAAYPGALNDNGFTNHPDDAGNTIHNLQVAAVADWQANFAKFFPQSFFDAYGMGVNVNAITTGDWINVYNQPNASPITYPWNIANTGGGKINGSFPIVSQDIEAKGYELEATVRPLRNWDLTFNASKLDAVQTALGAANSSFIEKEYQFFTGPAGNLPLWGFWGGGVNTSTTPYSLPLTSTLKGYFLQNIWSAYQLQTAQTGAAQPELRRWNFKLVTNYRFVNGVLKGVNVGGGYRWASKPILGYGATQTTDALGAPVWIMDVNKPLYGTIDEHVDAWIGYQRKLRGNLTWRIQLNVRNLGERPHLSPVSVEPDGTWAQERIMMGETYELTTKIAF